MLPAGPSGTQYDQAVDLHSGHHLTSRGETRKTAAHPAHHAHIGPETMIFDHGVPPMRYKEHARHKTATHKKIMRHANPHPMDAIRQSLPALLAQPAPAGLPAGGPPPAAPMGGM